MLAMEVTLAAQKVVSNLSSLEMYFHFPMTLLMLRKTHFVVSLLALVSSVEYESLNKRQI